MTEKLRKYLSLSLIVAPLIVSIVLGYCALTPPYLIDSSKFIFSAFVLSSISYLYLKKGQSDTENSGNVDRKIISYILLCYMPIVLVMFLLVFGIEKWLLTSFLVIPEIAALNASYALNAIIVSMGLAVMSLIAIKIPMHKEKLHPAIAVVICLLVVGTGGFSLYKWEQRSKDYINLYAMNENDSDLFYMINESQQNDLIDPDITNIYIFAYGYVKNSSAAKKEIALSLDSSANQANCSAQNVTLSAVELYSLHLETLAAKKDAVESFLSNNKLKSKKLITPLINEMESLASGIEFNDKMKLIDLMLSGKNQEAVNFYGSRLEGSDSFQIEGFDALPLSLYLNRFAQAPQGKGREKFIDMASDLSETWSKRVKSKNAFIETLECSSINNLDNFPTVPFSY